MNENEWINEILIIITSFTIFNLIFFGSSNDSSCRSSYGRDGIGSGSSSSAGGGGGSGRTIGDSRCSTERSGTFVVVLVVSVVGVVVVMIVVMGKGVVVVVGVEVSTPVSLKHTYQWKLCQHSYINKLRCACIKLPVRPLSDMFVYDTEFSFRIAVRNVLYA